MHLAGEPAREPLGQKAELFVVSGRRDAARVEPELGRPGPDFPAGHEIDYKDRMRRIVLLTLAAAAAFIATPRAQDTYAGFLFKYITSDSDAAARALMETRWTEIEAGVTAFGQTRAAGLVPGAAAMHTEAALRTKWPRTLATLTYHLDVATALVEFGEPGKLRPNTKRRFESRFLTPVSDEFRRVWYCAVITAMQSIGKLGTADPYLHHALALYPKDPDVLLLAAVAEEMRASPRLSDASSGARRRALETAEKHLRGAIAAAPEREEVRLRLGRVLQQRSAAAEARTLLLPLASSADRRIGYLAALFLGGLEDTAGNQQSALEWYDRAAARLPTAQSARVAASELRHRSGERREPSLDLQKALNETNDLDPWWSYTFGEHWLTDTWLDALRRHKKAS